MRFGGGDDDEAYADYLEEDGSMFGKMDKEEFMRIRDQAQEIAGGTTTGFFQRDERVWNQVKKLEDK